MMNILNIIILNARLRLAPPRRRIDGANTTAVYSAEYGLIHPSTGGLTRYAYDTI